MAFCRIFVALCVVNAVLLGIVMFYICWYFYKVSLMALESSITWLQRNKSPYSLITSNITAANISWEAASCVTKWLSMMKLLFLKDALLGRLFHSVLCYICFMLSLLNFIKEFKIWQMSVITFISCLLFKEIKWNLLQFP